MGNKQLGDAMFFIFGMSNDKKLLHISDVEIHDHCGRFGRHEVFMTYDYFSLFFIPVFKWNKKYFVVYNCCGKVYSLPKDIGEDIERNGNPNFTERDLIYDDEGEVPPNICTYCGYITEDDYTYCPNCGKLINK